MNMTSVGLSTSPHTWPTALKFEPQSLVEKMASLIHMFRITMKTVTKDDIFECEEIWKSEKMFQEALRRFRRNSRNACFMLNRTCHCHAGIELRRPVKDSRFTSAETKYPYLP
jgi:hypothetical protein